MGFLDKLFGRKETSNPDKKTDEPKKTITADQVKPRPSVSPAVAPKADAPKPSTVKAAEQEIPQPAKQVIPEKAKDTEAASPKPAVKNEADIHREHEREADEQETKKQMDEILVRFYGNDNGGLKKSQDSISYKKANK